MVSAGIKNKKTQGARKNKPSSPAYPASKRLNVPGKTHKNSPFNNKKTTTTMYPVSEPRKLLSSFLRILIIALRFVFWYSKPSAFH